MGNLIDEYGTLTDWLNTGIDDLSIKLGLKNGDIKTNGQVILLIRSKIIDSNHPDIFVDELAKQYGEWIQDIKEVFGRYIQQLVEFDNDSDNSDRKNSEVLRKQIEKIISESVDNNDGITFTKIIQEKCDEVDKYALYLRTIKYIDTNKDFFELAQQQGKIPYGTYDFFIDLQNELYSGGNRIQSDESDIEIYNEIKKYIKQIKTTKGKEVCQLPMLLQNLRIRLANVHFISDNMSDYLKKLIADNKLDYNSLLFMQENYPECKDLPIESFLAVIGKQLEPGKTVDTDEIKKIKSLEIESVRSLYSSEIKATIYVLREKFIGNCSEFEKRLKAQYAEAEEKTSVYARAPELTKSMLSKPTEKGDNPFIKSLKQQYLQTQMDLEVSRILSLPTEERAGILSEPIRENDSIALRQLKTKYQNTIGGMQNRKERDRVLKNSPDKIAKLLSQPINPKKDSDYLKRLKLRYALNRKEVEKEAEQLRMHELKTIFNREPDDLENLLTEEPNESDNMVLMKLKEEYKKDPNAIMDLAKKIRQGLNKKQDKGDEISEH